MLPLLAGDLLPSWAGPGVRVLLACVDGLFDAIPGILVMTHHDLLMPHFPGFAASAATYRGDMSASLDQKFAGGALLAVAESVGLPLLAAVFIEWMRADRASARRADAELDAQYGDGPGTTTPWWITAAPATSEGGADATPPPPRAKPTSHPIERRRPRGDAHHDSERSPSVAHGQFPG
ncbi:cytochrome c oxidase assembly protein [Dermacoccus abyssi]|uniref:Cytochrome c oxidase assembly protein n=1 Tax=Dermacoccus abyssi TaxID=322596 RepID=A0ABX5ZB40_9MICO|nr:cytochrome c oxidase assembly protein [Dermacoccus abyssi]